MAIAKTSAGAKIATLFALIPLGLLLWFAAPYVLPVWRWQHLDGKNAWARIAKEKDIAEAKLRTEFKVVLRHAPRSMGGKDPRPWQIVQSTPAWNEVDPDKNEDEKNVLVRCTIISDRDGTPPSDLWVGANKDEKYFTATVWRFPPGSFGKNAKRPVLVYQGGTLDHLPINDGQGFNTQVATMENDDKWEDRDDGFGTTADP